MKMNPLVRLFAEYFASGLEIRVRVFNLLALAGMCLGLIVGASCFVTGAGWLNAVINFGAAVFAAFILIYARRSGRYQLCYIITVVAVFIIAFPVMFFSAGGYHSGMPSFFVFAVVFTVLMLESRRLKMLAVLEALIYAACFLIAYHYPETITQFATEADAAQDIFIGFAGAGLALTAVVLMHLQFYRDYHDLIDEKNKTLERLNSLKTEFLGSVSHELKAPLIVISDYAQFSDMLLADAEKNMDQLHANMTDTVLEAERAARIIHQLLDIAAIDNYGEIPLDRTPFDLSSIAKIVERTHFPVLDSRGNTLTVSIPPDLPMIDGDSERLLEVLINLVSNAVKNTENGTVTIAAERSADTLTVSVTDTGAGMEQELADTLLERYPKTAGRRVARTGLGLYFCDRVIAAHGGGLHIESEPGKGTTAWFTLPIGGEAVGG
jgi:signal transduction histidine kinase